MIVKEKILKGFETAESRWARFGPYYAMFPLDFAFDVVERYSKEGDYIIDPFAGRCSSIYAGGVLGRNSLGIEINPVGWLYGTVKLNPANKEDVIDRLLEIYGKRNDYTESIQRMPDWKENNIDATLMSILLIYLHAKLGEGLSNQMRMTKSMGMNYSILWWKKNNMVSPPIINPCDFIVKKIEWRYKKGTPKVTKDSVVILGDSSNELVNVVEQSLNNNTKFSLLFTSPPYCSITDYHADQWLRLWLLGGSESPQALDGKYRGRFVNKQEYYDLLDNVFNLCSKVMKEKSIIYVRTDRREFTFNSTLEILKKCFPNHSTKIIENPLSENTKTQTKLFGDKTIKPGEVDIIMTGK